MIKIATIEDEENIRQEIVRYGLKSHCYGQCIEK